MEAHHAEHVEPYTYILLNEERQEIRLLTLHPGTFSSEIRLSLDITPLTKVKTPLFEAVSYTWGSAENPVNIFIGDSGRSQLAVTQNLAEALPRLRYQDRPRVLWIDAVCVDQKNLEERSQQVNRMADIFSKASKVLVWLGPAKYDSSLALELFQEIASYVYVDKRTEKLVAISDHEDWADKYYGLPFQEDELKAILHLFRRPWFSRLWIWQEVHLSSNDPVLICGNLEMSWSAFRTAAICLYQKPQDKFDGLLEYFDLHEVVYSLCIGMPGASVEELLYRTKRCQCTDPRDRIYAILSLLIIALQYLLRRITQKASMRHTKMQQFR